MVKVKENLAGKQFGSWLVLYQTDDIIRPNGVHHQAWMCKCLKCGKIKSVDGETLKRGQSVCCKECSKGHKKDFNEYSIKDQKVYVKLTQNQVCCIDLEDLPKINKYRWIAIKDHNNQQENYYAVARNRKSVNNSIDKKMIRMHCLIMESDFVDHKDCNGLNNCKENLRIYTDMSLNNANSRKRKNTITKYKGVYAEGKRYRSYIKFHNKTIIIGFFDTEEEAAKAYDLKAIELFGEYARLNFPETH